MFPYHKSAANVHSLMSATSPGDTYNRKPAAQEAVAGQFWMENIVTASPLWRDS